MSSKSWLILIVFVAWSAISWRVYTCEIQGLCPDEEAASVDEVVVLESQPQTPKLDPIQKTSETSIVMPANEHLNVLSQHLPVDFTFMYNSAVESKPKPARKKVVRKTTAKPNAKSSKKTTPPPVKKERDDLTRLQGIGPKIQGVLNENGIETFTELGKTGIKELQKFLEEAGAITSKETVKSWPKNAKKMK